MNRRGRGGAEPSSALPVPELIQGDWTSLVILTYSANLGFFETHLLRQLGRVPQRLILADDRRLAETFTRAAETGQRLANANRTYLAAPVRNARAAHAKVALLTTKTDGLLLIGSGNLSQDGYASSGELWHVYAYADGAPEHLGQFAAVRFLIDGIISREWIDPPAVELLHQVWAETPWLAEQPSTAPLVRHNLDTPLVDAIAEAVTWPVQTLTVHAPFFDPEAQALASLLDRLRPRRLRVLLTRDTSVDIEALRTAVTRPRLDVSFLQATVTDAPRTFLHAKFIHAVGADREVMLTGSANLSRSALLLTANGGNLELGVIETRPRGGFDAVYRPLTLSPIADIAALDLSYDTTAEAQPPVDVPVLLWSEIARGSLTLVFDRQVDTAGLTLIGPDGTPLTPLAVHADGKTIRLDLNGTDLDQVAGGGPLEVGVVHDGQVHEPRPTWPYHTETLKGRLGRASQNTLLAQSGTLPGTDSELFELLQQLEQTLIFDPISAWKVARPTDPVHPIDGDEQPALRWVDLDWERIRRHPRYAGYHHFGRKLSLPPTDVQVVLASIAARLSDFGTQLVTNGEADSDDVVGEVELGHESAQTATETQEHGDGDDEPPDELDRRRLSVSARTRRAFNRFVARLAAAVRDPQFQDALGPIIAVQNAVIFNHLLRQLLQKHAVDLRYAVEAQLAVWTLLWGTGTETGLLASLQGDERHAADQILIETQTRRTVVGALSDLAEYDVDEELAIALRHQVQYLLVDPIFNFESRVVAAAAPDPTQAAALLANLRWLAAPSTDHDATTEVLAPWDLPPTAARWEQTKVRRSTPGGREAREEYVHVLELASPVAGLTTEAARAALARLVTYADVAGWGLDYFRIRFATGRDVCFWDARVGQG
ncbi:phospholipase D-like domain-containing protein [Dactylosporangium darangshiense]